MKKLFTFAFFALLLQFNLLQAQNNRLTITSIEVDVQTTTDDKEDSEFQLFVYQGNRLVHAFKEGCGDNWDNGSVRNFEINDLNIPVDYQPIKVLARLQDRECGRRNHWNCIIEVKVYASVSGSNDNQSLSWKSACAFRTARSKPSHSIDLGRRSFRRS